MFGNLEYYCLDDENDSYPLTSLTQSINTHLERLWGTKKEIEQIWEISKKTKISSIMYSYCNGTEHNFYDLMEKDIVDVLHFATHAFNGEPMIKNKIHSIQDYMLSRCGLFLSGAGDNINQEEKIIIKNNRDGILTGTEIAKTSLKKLDLVTLSTSNSNVGLANNLFSVASENSWSLSHAFKIAGTKAILSSLWAVDDEATSQLMIEFYRNWLKGKMTLRQSLEKARNALRISEKWNEPKYWASFVLLDGFD